MIEFLRKWWRDWAKVDLVTLGLGVSISWGYIAYRTQNPGFESPYLDIWSDLSAGLLGAWLSIRLIDTIIQSREQRHSVRRVLWGNLNYIRGLARKLLPRLYEFDVLSLNDELMWARERMTNRQKHLYKSELDGINKVLTELEVLVQQAKRCLEAKHKIGEYRYRIRSIFDDLNESRDTVRLSLDQMDRHKDSYGALALSLSNSLDRCAQAFSPVEVAQLQAFCQQVGAVQSEDDFLDLYYDRPRIEKIYEHDIRWLPKIEYAYNDMQDWKSFDLQALYTAVTEAKSQVQAGLLPAILASPFTDYLDSIQSEANQRMEIERAIGRLVEVIDRTRADITEESELD